MILRSVLTEMEKPFCEEDCPGPLPLPRRAHTDRAEIIRQRRREYGALPVEETPHLSLNWIGYFPCRAISRGAQTPNRVLVVCGAGRGVSSFAVATWQLGSLPPPSSQDHLRHLARTARATLIVLPPRYPSSPRHRKSLHREPASAPADDFWPSTHGQFVGQPQPSWLKSHGRRHTCMRNTPVENMKHHSARSDSCGTRHAQRLSNTSHLVNIGPVPFSPPLWKSAGWGTA